MRAFGTFFLVLVFVATAACQDKAKKRKGKITVGKETTYITGPLDKEGYVDYVAALNERLSQGVTLENNANVLLWKAIGPRRESGEPVPAEYFRWLGIPAPQERGDYFLDLTRYLKERAQVDSDKEADAISEQLEHALRRPWKATECPSLAAWLKANEKSLAVAVEASRRARYFSPLVPTRSKEGSSGLMGALLPGVQRCRGLANALTARAMLRISQGNDDDAWQDLLACHRLGRLVARGGTVIEFLVGVASDHTASRADLAFLDKTRPKSQRIASCLRDLHQLPAVPAVVDKVDLAERFTFLEAITLVDRQGLRYLEKLEGGAAKNLPPFDERIVLRDIDWDPALRTANRWHNRLVTALREKDRRVRDKMLKQVDTDLRELRAEIADIGTLAVLLDPKQTGQARGKLLGDVLVTLLMPALHKIQGAADRAQQVQDNLLIAFALERYQRDQGGYPKTLDALAPKYLKQVPRDLFSGQALIYRPTANGYLLYSVGVNGKDEGGRGYEDDPQGDDLSVRMPLPKLRRP